jgi:cell division protein FtsX
MSENEIKEENIPSSVASEVKEIPHNKEYTDDNQSKTKLQEVIEFFRDLVIIFIVVIFIRTFIVAPFQISGSSMEESYHDGEFILVNKFSYADF